MIRLNDAVLVELDDRGCTPLESTMLGLKLAMWPLFQKEMDSHVESVKRMADAAGNSRFGAMLRGAAPKDSAVKEVSRLLVDHGKVLTCNLPFAVRVGCNSLRSPRVAHSSTQPGQRGSHAGKQASHPSSCGPSMLTHRRSQLDQTPQRSHATHHAASRQIEDCSRSRILRLHRVRRDNTRADERSSRREPCEATIRTWLLQGKRGRGEAENADVDHKLDVHDWLVDGYYKNSSIRDFLAMTNVDRHRLLSSCISVMLWFLLFQDVFQDFL